MSDGYIRKQDAKDALQEKVFHNLIDEFYGAMQVLDELEPADVVTVVRCRDCRKCSYDSLFDHWWCNMTLGTRRVKPDDFCSYGEREE